MDQNVAVQAGVALLASSLPLILIIVIAILITVPMSKFIYKAIKGSSGYNAGGCLVFSIAFLPCLPAYIIAVKRYNKEVKKFVEPIKEKIQTNPCDSNVDAYMDMIEEYGILNEPQSWNQVRAIWFMVNESPDVTTDKKRQLRNFLMAKGLRLTNSDKNVIDNYKA